METFIEVTCIALIACGGLPRFGFRPEKRRDRDVVVEHHLFGTFQEQGALEFAHHHSSIVL